MKKTLLSALLLFSLLVTQLATPAALAAEGDGAGTSSTVESMYIQAKAAILVDDDYGEVLYEQNAHEKNYPASITKVMTTLLVLEAVDRGEAALTDIVTVGDEVNLGIGEGGSGVGLKEGEQLSLEDLLYCALTASANEACNALAQYLCGDVATFVERMNQRAAELGMENTHFVNCNGLPAEGHVTTARDIALMSRELLKHDQIFAYTTLWMDSVRDGAFGLTNTNRLIRTYQGMNGLKTGYTTAAGYCLSATAERDGLSLIAVVMGAASADARNADVTAMLNYGFANYQAVTITTDRPIMPVPVQLGVQGSVLCQLQSQGPLVMEKSKVGALEKDLVMAEKLQAPVQQGQQVGTLHLTANGEEVAAVPIVAAEAVEKQGVLSLFCQLLRTCCMRQAQG